MNKVKNILWGAVLVIFGLLFALDALDIISFSLFFDGWWTFIIIIPCAIGLITEQNKLGNIIGIVIGVALLLASRGVIGFDMIWKLALPVSIVAVGIALICKAVIGKDGREAEKKLKENKIELQEYCATFSGIDLDFTDQVFDGASLTAVFGGVKLDLTGAMINEDAVIKVCSVFGGADIILPENVNVKISSSSIFGGMSDKKKRERKDGQPTVYINGSCIFGGCDIK